MRRSYLKEGEVQLTALNSLLTQSRYLFLFSDLLLVAKQKAENSYKLKEKVRLDRLWIASNNCPHSFLVGWPICNYIAHFSSEEKKIEWHDILEERIQKCRLKAIPKFTTLPLIVKIGGRNQTMKKKLSISQTSSELLLELVGELGLSKDLELELAFDNGGGDEPTVLQGPEAVYCIIMDFIRSTGYRLSEKQLERLDTFPLVNCKLVLLSSYSQKTNAAQTLVTHFKGPKFRRVLSRTEPRRFFGKQLDGSCPPQPVLTMIDHLLVNGVHTEGLFRKSPKQTTVRMVKAQLNRGSVPDFAQFSPHVTAAILKEYLRSIPGKLLQTCDLNMWMAAIESNGPERITQIKGFLQLLPSSHIVLLSSLLRLLRAVAKSPSSKMNVQSLAVCIAPNLLDSPKIECAARKLPQIAEWLITNAPLLFDDFVDAQCDVSSSASNDSGLSDVEVGVEVPLNSEFTETYIISTPASSVGSVNSSPVVRCKIEEIKMSPSSYCSSNLSTDDEMDISTEMERDDDRTPVLSRENSNAEKKPVTYIEWKSAKRERFIESSEGDPHWKDGKSLKRRETVGVLYRRTEEIIGNSIPYALAEHKPVTVSLSVTSRASPQNCYKLSTSSSSILSVYALNGNSKCVDDEVNEESAIDAIHPKLANSDVSEGFCLTESSHDIIILPYGESREHHNVSTFDESKDVNLSKTGKVGDFAAQSFKTPLISTQKLSLKATNSLPMKSQIEISRKSGHNYSDVNECLKTEQKHSDKNLASILPLSEAFNRSLRTSQCLEKSASSREAQNVCCSGKSVPLNFTTHYPDTQQIPSTSKSFSDLVTAIKKYDEQSDSSIKTCKTALDLNKPVRKKPVAAGKRCSLETVNKPPFVCQTDLLHGTSYDFHKPLRRVSESQSCSGEKCSTGNDIKFKEKADLVAKTLQIQPSSLTINFPLYKPTIQTHPHSELSNKKVVNSSCRSDERVDSKYSFTSRSISKTVDVCSEQQPDRCDSLRKERKKNRSILMDPLEVNWSVDELRQKFQTDNSPPTFNTEYSPVVSL